MTEADANPGSLFYLRQPYCGQVHRVFKPSEGWRGPGKGHGLAQHKALLLQEDVHFKHRNYIPDYSLLRGAEKTHVRDPVGNRIIINNVSIRSVLCLLSLQSAAD